jgi:hypothetical protein
MLDDLKMVILKAISKGTDVCVAMDANEALDTKNQHFHEWIAECCLISIHENVYNEEYYEANKIPTTHQNSTSKIDHVFCTPCLFWSVKGVAIEPLHDGIFSDHWALIVDFDTGTSHSHHEAKNKTPSINLEKAMHQYCVKFDYRLQAQNSHANKLLTKCQTTAATTPWMDKQANMIDKYITNCMLKAEATIHEHNLFSPHKVEMALMEKKLEACPTGQLVQLQTTNPANGKHNQLLSKHGHHG